MMEKVNHINSQAFNNTSSILKFGQVNLDSAMTESGHTRLSWVSSSSSHPKSPSNTFHTTQMTNPNPKSLSSTMIPSMESDDSILLQPWFYQLNKT